MAIRLSVLYPHSDGTTFDHDYYRATHVPMACRAWGLECAEIDRGINGPYVAGVHFRFESMEAMEQAMGSPDTEKVIADVANYTSIVPVQQVSEIVS